MTGKSILNFLTKSHDEIYLIEENPDNPSLSDLSNYDTKVHVNPFIGDDFFEKVSVIYVSPGISKEHPIILKGNENKILISSDIEEFLNNSKSLKIVVTGTNGKTSTSLMIEALLKAFYPHLKIKCIGNIGNPALPCLEQEIDVSVIEASSFQLELINEAQFEIGVLLNVHEDHLDRHKSFDEYRDIKKKVLKFSEYNISFDDSNDLRKEHKNYDLFEMPEDVINSKFYKSWPKHDLQNLKAAICVLDFFSQIYKQAPLNESNFYANIQIALESFKKPEHRFELLAEVKGIQYINDSKATNLHATINAIQAVNRFKEKGNLFLICGGDLKGQDLSVLDPDIIKSIKEIFIFGKDKDTLFESMHKHTNCFIEKSLEDAVRKASKNAKDSDYVLLSPACSSLDMFEDYQARGIKFKEIVEEIRNE